MTHPDRWLPWLTCGVTFGWGLGQLARDITWASGVLFYIPSPVVAVMLLITAVMALRSRRRRLGLLCCLLLPAPLLVVVLLEHRLLAGTTEPPPVGTQLRVVHWNVFRGYLGADRIVDTLQSVDADLVVLSEAPAAEINMQYPYVLRQGSLCLLSRFPLTTDQDLSRDSSEVYTVRWITPEGELQLLLADLPSSLLIHRHPLLTRLTTQLQQTQADLLLGDLNAPRRSLALSHLPDGYRHASEVAGTGWSATWPSPCPLYAIDHCVCGPQIQPLEYQLHTRICSDHRLQILDFCILPPQEPTSWQHPRAKRPITAEDGSRSWQSPARYQAANGSLNTAGVVPESQ